MAIAFQKLITPFSGNSPLTSGAFTPNAAGDTLIFVSVDFSNNVACTFSGTGGTYTTSGGDFPFVDPAFDETATGYLLSASASSQTTTCTATSGDGMVAQGIDYSGVSSVGAPTVVSRSAPGTGANAIAGTAVTVPSGSTLLSFCYNASSGTDTITTSGTDLGGGTGSDDFDMPYRWSGQAGSGGSLTPQFTTSADGTDGFVVIQWLLTGSGGSGAAFASGPKNKDSATAAISTSIKPASGSHAVSTGKASATTAIKPNSAGRAKASATGVPTTKISPVSGGRAKSTASAAATTSIKASANAGAKSTGLATLTTNAAGQVASGRSKSTATASATTAIRAASGSSSKSLASSVPTTAIRLASGSHAASKATAGFTTGIALASGAAARNSARSAPTTQVKLAGAVRGVSTGRAAFASTSTGTARGFGICSALGGLTNWASVTLSGTLYTGEGSIVGPHAWWSAGAPAPGDTVYYDPTNMTVMPDGEVVGTTNNFRAECVWLPAAGVASFLALVVTPGFASWSQNASSGVGTPATTLKLLSACRDVSSAQASLFTRSRILGNAAAKNTAAASGFITGIALRSSSVARSSAGGTPATAIPFAGHARNALTARGEPGSGMLFSSTSRAKSSGAAAAQTKIRFVSFPRSISTGLSRLAFGARFASASSSRSSAGAPMATAIALASISYSVSTAEAGNTISLVSRAVSSRSTGLLAAGPTPRFGWAEVIALSQNGFQAEESAYVENSAAYVQATYFDSDGNLFVPVAVSYRIDDLESGENIVPITAIVPQDTNIVAISENENYMVNATRDSENHQALFQITDGFGNVAYERAVFAVIRVSGTD